jgi:hypothetical protein
VKLLDWFKSAVAVAKTPAEQPKAEAQPREPVQGDAPPAAASTAPAAVLPATPPQAKSESVQPIARTPAFEFLPTPPPRVEPEAPLAVEPEERRIESDDELDVEPDDAEEPEAATEAQPSTRIEESARIAEPAGPPDQDEIDRRRGLVRRFFNDYWSSVDEKPASFAERLDGAEGYINERVAAGGEGWQLDSATRKQLGLPAPKKR